MTLLWVANNLVTFGGQEVAWKQHGDERNFIIWVEIVGFSEWSYALH
jgi:hypothetical protein